MSNDDANTDYFEVFKTGVQNQSEAQEIISLLHAQFPGADLNFDLHDCDNILRVVYNRDITAEVIEALNKKGYYCEVLEG